MSEENYTLISNIITLREARALDSKLHKLPPANFQLKLNPRHTLTDMENLLGETRGDYTGYADIIHLLRKIISRYYEDTWIQVEGNKFGDCLTWNEYQDLFTKYESPIMNLIDYEIPRSKGNRTPYKDEKLGIEFIPDCINTFIQCTKKTVFYNIKYREFESDLDDKELKKYILLYAVLEKYDKRQYIFFDNADPENIKKIESDLAVK